MNKLHFPRTPRSQGGFTLIEVMVVVVILGIMAALVVPNLVGKQDQAMVTPAKSDIPAFPNPLAVPPLLIMNLQRELIYEIQLLFS